MTAPRSSPPPRRSFVLGLAASIAAASMPRRAVADRAQEPPQAPPFDLEVLDFSVDGDKSLGRRFVLLSPKHLQKGEKVPLLVLLHGLGETGDERMGAYAWLERYGAATSYERLRRPPVQRASKRPYLPDARVAALNTGLAKSPFRGIALVCPFTPNVQKMNRASALDGYARWLCEVVIPRARREAPVLTDTANTGLDGVSLGGYIGLEVFLRRPEAFGAWGGVQSAIMAHRADEYATKIAAVAAKAARPLRLHIETSEGDPFREANELLSKKLHEHGVGNDLLVLPGPHDQPWLREAGTLEMLFWHDQKLRP